MMLPKISHLFIFVTMCPNNENSFSYIDFVLQLEQDTKYTSIQKQCAFLFERPNIFL